MDIENTQNESNFWSLRYKEGRTGWDIGYPSAPIKAYIDQLENKDFKILIPGAGNAYEAEYLFEQGFTKTFILDISPTPLAEFQNRNPNFPRQQLVEGNFFHHTDQYDLVIEQTFFCSFPPTLENRKAYARKMSELVKPGGKLVGLWFNMPLTGDMVKRPFGGDREEYLSYLKPYFRVNTFEACYNSIPPRAGNELFGIFERLN